MEGSTLPRRCRIVTNIVIALVALIIVRLTFNAAAGRNWLGCKSNPLATCESQIQADAQYSSWGGSLPACCTGKTNGTFTLNDTQLHQASAYAIQQLQATNFSGPKSGNVQYPG